MGVTMITSLTSPAPQALGGMTLADDTVAEQSGQAPASSFSRMLDSRSGIGEEKQTSAFSSESDGLSKNRMEQPSAQDVETKLQLPAQQTLSKQQISNFKLQTIQEQTQIAQSATMDSALSTLTSPVKSAGDNVEVSAESICEGETDETSSKESGQRQSAGASVAALPWTQLLVPANTVPVSVSAGTTSDVNRGDPMQPEEGVSATIAGTKEPGPVSKLNLNLASSADATALMSTAGATQKPVSQPVIAAGRLTTSGSSENLQQGTRSDKSTDTAAVAGKALANNTATLKAKSLYAQFSGNDPSLMIEKKAAGIQGTENSVISTSAEIKAKTDVTVTLTSTVKGDLQPSASIGQMNVKTSQPDGSTVTFVSADGKASNGELPAETSETAVDAVNGQAKNSSLQTAGVSQTEGAGDTASAVQSVGKEPSSIKPKNGKQTEKSAENTAGNSSVSAKSGAEAGKLRRGPDQTASSETKQGEQADREGQNLKPDASKGADMATQAAVSHRQGEMHVNSDNRLTTSSNEAKGPTTEQLHGQIREKLESGDFRADKSSITLKLNPQELGELRINMKMDDQRLKVEIVTENKSVKEALMQNLDSLKETLSRQNISMDQFNVSADIRQGFQQNQKNENRMAQGNGRDNPAFQGDRVPEEGVQQVFNYGWENDSSLVSLVL